MLYSWQIYVDHFIRQTEFFQRNCNLVTIWGECRVEDYLLVAHHSENYLFSVDGCVPRALGSLEAHSLWNKELLLYSTICNQYEAARWNLVIHECFDTYQGASLYQGFEFPTKVLPEDRRVNFGLVSSFPPYTISWAESGHLERGLNLLWQTLGFQSGWCLNDRLYLAL